MDVAEQVIRRELMAEELASQPEAWAQAAEIGAAADALPAPGERVAVIGCGTSWFMAQSYAALREGAGLGVTDAFAASEASLDRGYDVLLAITRSGTTSEVLDRLRRNPGARRVGIVGNADTPLITLVDDQVVLPFADESSVVQTRFATSALAALRASIGHDLADAIADARTAIEAPVDDELVAAEQITLLGRGWTIGLANEGALKLREAAQSWTESYPAMEYRHGPISIAAPNRATWMLGEAPPGLGDDVAATGALWVQSGLDPMAELVRVQRVALARARARGLDPDRPRHLTRSVILPPGR